MAYSSTIPAETLATPDDLWVLDTLFKADWKEAISVQSSFETDIKYALSASEQRFGLQGKPVREISCTLLALTQEESQALYALAMRKSIARSLFPLFSDPSLLTASAADTDTVIYCDTRYRRFAADQRVVILKRTSDPQADLFTIGVIASLTDSSITLSAAIGEDFDTGAVVLPLIEAQISLSAQGSAITQRMKTLSISAIELEGDTQLEPSQAFNTTPSGFSEYDGLPVLDIQHLESGDVKWGVERYGSISASGNQSIPTVYGDRGSLTWELPYLQFDRETAWSLLNFFESRGGSLFPFWFVCPDQLYTPIEIITIGVSVLSPVVRIRVAKVATELDWTFRPFLAVKLKDGSLYIREISSITRESDADNILLSSSIPHFSLSQVQRVTLAFKARLDTDALEEEWVTSSIVSMSFSVRELLNEKTITIENFPDVNSTPLPNKWKAPGKCGGCGSETIEECLCGCMVQLGEPSTPPFCCYVGGRDAPPDFTAAIVALVDGSVDQNFRIAGDERAKFVEGAIFTVSGSTGNDGDYTVSFSSTTPDRDFTYIFVEETIPDGTVDGTVSIGIIDTPDTLMTAKFRSVVSEWFFCVLVPLDPQPGTDCGIDCDPWFQTGICEGAVCPGTELFTDMSYANAVIHEEIVEMIEPTTMRCDSPDEETWLRDASMQKTVRESGHYPCFAPCDLETEPSEDITTEDGGLIRYNQRTGSPPEFQAEEWWVSPAIAGRPAAPPHPGETCADDPGLNDVTRLLCELYQTTLPHGCFDVDGSGGTFLEIDTGVLLVSSEDPCGGYQQNVFSIEVEVRRCSNGLWSSEFVDPSTAECVTCQT